MDIGCGTGAWAIEFADRHPRCQVTGTDLSPIQPDIVPRNAEFIVDDITSEWVYPQEFDFIHSRAITVGIKDWSALVDQVWKNLKPGGWIEFQEYHFPFTSDDDTLKLCPALDLWNNNLASASAKAGMRLDAILSVPEILQEKGFANIDQAATKWPLGPWAKGKKEKKVGELLERVRLATQCNGLLMGGSADQRFRIFSGLLKAPVCDCTPKYSDGVKKPCASMSRRYMMIFGPGKRMRISQCESILMGVRRAVSLLTGWQ